MISRWRGRRRSKRLDRPCLQRFGHQRVVRVREGAPGDIPRAVPIERRGYRRAGASAPEWRWRDACRSAESRLGRVARRSRWCVVRKRRTMSWSDAETKKYCCLSRSSRPTLRRVVRVQHLRQVLGLGLLLDGLDVVAFVEVLEVEVARRLGRPEAHVVHRVACRSPGTGVS